MSSRLTIQINTQALKSGFFKYNTPFEVPVTEMISPVEYQEFTKDCKVF
ncbi:MAG: hypothetical protein LBC61_06045 [Candidatus Peribacteria bacterium]|nr:hypothetical protein [Candidatus Peribacteria bacterium]